MDDNSNRIDQRLLQAYLATTYHIDTPAIDIRIGVLNRALDTLLKEHDVVCWAFLSAWNPGSKQLSDTENDKRHQQLLDYLNAAGYPYLLGWGIGDQGDWPPERSVLVLGMDASLAQHVAQLFQQNAIVRGMRGQVPVLEWI